MKTYVRKKTANRLWLARKRAGLEQKHVAYLLTHKTIDQISRYENGARLPRLEVALKLEIILGVPVRSLFPELYLQLTRDIQTRAAKNGFLRDKQRVIFGDGLCTYAEYLSALIVLPDEFSKAHSHAIAMVNKVSERARDFLDTNH